jgi:transposase
MKKTIVFIVAAAAIAALILVPSGAGKQTDEKKEETVQHTIDILEKATRIDMYFQERDMPLEGKGMKMVVESEKNKIDWRLLPAISIRESSGGLQACGNNPFGWASCKKPIGTFASVDIAIETVARHLGGNATTTKSFYGGKDTKGKLQAYNPPSVVRLYAEEVMAIMEAIGPEVVR